MCTVPQVSELDLTDIDIVAIDLETSDPNLKTKTYVRYFIMQYTMYVGLELQLETCLKENY